MTSRPLALMLLMRTAPARMKKTSSVRSFSLRISAFFL